MDCYGMPSVPRFLLKNNLRTSEDIVKKYNRSEKVIIGVLLGMTAVLFLGSLFFWYVFSTI